MSLGSGRSVTKTDEMMSVVGKKTNNPAPATAKLILMIMLTCLSLEPTVYSVEFLNYLRTCGNVHSTKEISLE